MARIRTIKPDFWTDEKLTECSLSARLLFIGTWNFADDNGNFQASAKKLKMQIFPADNIDCQPLIDELITHGVLIEYSVNGEKFLHIKGFKKHQVINRPSSSSIPTPDFSDDSVSAQGVLIDGKEGKGKERKIHSRISFDNETGFSIPDETLKAWRSAYPSVQVSSELSKMAAWIISNPTKAPKSNYSRFINSWLSRAKPQKPDSQFGPGNII